MGHGLMNANSVIPCNVHLLVIGLPMIGIAGHESMLMD